MKGISKLRPFVGITEADYYQILGVSPTASEQEIKLAYRKLALVYHPDSLGSTSHSEKFLHIRKAYELLIDPITRAEYDQRRKANAWNVSTVKVDPTEVKLRQKRKDSLHKLKVDSRIISAPVEEPRFSTKPLPKPPETELLQDRNVGIKKAKSGRGFSVIRFFRQLFR